MKIKYHTIQVDLEPDNDPESVGMEYRAIVMKHFTDGTSCNGGVVVRSSTPEEAFRLGLKQWNLLNKNKA